MGEISRADEFLLEQIRAGDGDAWSQLVERYQGRLVAFARSRLGGRADAEDMVQETFLSFLRGAATFRGEASLETYLFTILRRRIIDLHRGKKLAACSLQDAPGSADEDERIDPPGPSPTGSWYVRQDEELSIRRRVLGEALRSLADGYRDSLNFRDLKVIELLFYAQQRNKVIADLADVTQQHVGLLKHRCLKRVKDLVDAGLAEAGVDAAADAELWRSEEDAAALLRDAWEAKRPSCPKRNTIGAAQLGSLDDDWADYVAFHLDVLGCRFCLANRDDLQKQADASEQAAFRNRILQSSVGFLSRA